MAYNPVNPNGQATSDNSSPVVIASDQSAVKVAVNDGSGNSISSTSGALNVNVNNAALTGTETFAQTSNSSVAWTSSTSLNTAMTLSGLSGYGTVMVSFVASGTLSAGTINFEAFDGTNWWPVPMARNNSYTLDNSYVLSGANQVWFGDIAGYQQFRVRLNPVISGSGTANIIAAAMAADNVTNLVVGQPTAANLNATVTQASGNWNNNLAQVAGNTASTAASGTLLVGSADGSGNKLTSNSTTTSSKFALDHNILSILGTAPTTAGYLNVQGNPTGSAIPSYAIAAGFQARTSEASATSNTDNTVAVVDKVGKLIVLPYANPENFISNSVSTTGTTATSVIAAAGSGVQIYVTDIIIANTGSATTLVTITQGSGGTTILQTIAPAGGGSNIHLSCPLASGANTAIYATAATATTTLYVTISGYKGA